MLACAALLIVFGAVAAWALSRGDTPAEPVEQGGWSGQSMLCGYREGEDPLNDMERGEVVAIGDEAAATLTLARCGIGDRGERGLPALSPGSSYFVAFTGADRHNVALVKVDAEATPPQLVAEHTVSGDGCAETADYRGQLMLLIEGPAGAPVPKVELRQFALGC